MLTTPNDHTSAFAVTLSSKAIYANEPHRVLSDDVVCDDAIIPVSPVDANVSNPKSANFKWKIQNCYQIIQIIQYSRYCH